MALAVQDCSRRLFYEDCSGASINVSVAVHNEGDRVVSTVRQISLALWGLGRSWEVVIVDDGSTNETLKHITPLEAKLPHIVMT